MPFKLPKFSDKSEFLDNNKPDEKSINLTDTAATYSTFKRTGNDDSIETFTVDDAIEKCGFGKFQIFLSVATGIAWMADSMETMVLSIIGPVLQCEWGISELEEAMLTTIVFSGYIVGAPLFGKFADKYSRQKEIILAAGCASYFGILNSIAPSYTWVIILRFLCGMGIGGVPQAVTYYAEFLPIETRGKSIVLLQLFWASGGVVEVLLAMWLIPDYGWRVWLFASAVPLGVVALFSFWLPTSPRFDLAAGKTEKAKDTLELIARTNGCTLPKGVLVSQGSVPRGRVMDLLSPKYRRITITLWVIWFCAVFCYYGLILMATDLINGDIWCVTTQTSLTETGQGHLCLLECKTLDMEDYTSILITTAAELPGVLVVACIIDRIGRKNTMMLEYVSFSVVIFLFYICVSTSYIVFLLFVARALVASAFQVVYVFTPEVYPTHIRALGIGVPCGLGRIGAVVTPFVAQVLMAKSIPTGLAVYGGVGLFTAAVCFFLPYDTTGKSMGDM